MTGKDQSSFKFWQELKRRNVPRVMAIYAGTAFIVLEAADIIFPRWGFPDWTVDLVLYLLLLGALITFILSWVYDISPGGIVKTAPEELAKAKGQRSPEPVRKPYISTVIIAVLIVVIGVLMYPKIFRNSDSPLGGTNRSSIAVLPLKIIGDDSELNFFASGLVESLTHMLSKVGNSNQSFSVIPPSEILEAITAGEAREKFGVSLVISGSIQMDQTSSRLILNLIDAKTQNLIRSEKLDYSKEKNLIIQDELISVMVSMLGLELESDTKDLIALGGSILNDANELYLTGRGILREGVGSEMVIDDALDLFRSAIDQDSLFALAYAGMAQAYTMKYHFTLDAAWNDESLKYSRKAVELNDQDAYALMSLAASLVEKGAFEEALIYYEKSKGIDSTRAIIFSELAYLYEMVGEMELAEQHNLKAIELDPDSHLTHYYLGGFYFAQARFDEALVKFEKALKYAPGHLTIKHAIASCYYELEDFDDALRIFEEILQVDSAQGQVLWNVGSIYYYQGDFEKAISYYKKGLEYTPQNYKLHGALGRAYLFSNKEAMASESFQQAISIAHQDITCPDILFATWFGFMGNVDSADFYIKRLNPPDNPVEVDAFTAFVIGEFYLISEKGELGRSFIENALQRGYGWRDVEYSPLYRKLRHDEEFQDMLIRSKNSME